MQARNATLPDAFAIESLISAKVHDGTLLPRSLAEICENIRDFIVVEDGKEIIGCGALHLYGPHLAEVRSITIRSSENGRGAGLLMVRALLREARRHHVTCICLFTRIPKFFAKLGFRVADDRHRIPDKVYKDCQHCPRQNACDEIAMYRGKLPTFAILASPENASALVQLAASAPPNP
jgi:amino-acid N-acetyltransferase